MGSQITARLAQHRANAYETGRLTCEKVKGWEVGGTYDAGTADTLENFALIRPAAHQKSTAYHLRP